MERLVTPKCDVSGLPLPVLPLESRVFGTLLNSRQTNEHHHFHPERSQQLLTPAGLALRRCRVQVLPVSTHNEYHKIYDGPELATDENEVFRQIVLSVAGVVPRRAIDVREPGRTVGLTDASHTKIVSATKLDQKKDVSNFLAQYCSLQEADSELMSWMLDPDSEPDFRLDIARLILEDSIDIALGNLIDEHRQMKKEKLVTLMRAPSLYSATRTLIRRHALGTFTRSLIANHAA